MTGPSEARPRATRWRRLAAAVAVGLAVTGLGYAGSAVSAAAAPEALGPGTVTVTLDVEHSRFVPDRIHVRPGTLVRFVVDNGDPIHHELVVGPPEVHAAHADGTDHVHPPIPGEVSVGPHERGVTFLRFDEPGTVDFACHLPGHVAHGMVGTVTVG